MKNPEKLVVGYLVALFVTTYMVMNLAKAEASESGTVVAVEAIDGGQLVDAKVVELDQQEIEALLAPIALYPDALLSQVLVASTYPLEVVQAARWRKFNSELNEDEALEAVQDKDWDPSVKALVPYSDLLERLSKDLTWLQELGEAFLANEEQVLVSVQHLRRKAHEQGNLQDNEYIEVVEEEDNIIIEPARTEVVYVPYYDTRVVYGPWWWSVSPVVWVHPNHYSWHSGFYWGPRVYVRPTYFYSTFHWHTRHVVVDQHYYTREVRRYQQPRRVNVTEYQRWRHDPTHRRNVRYRHSANKTTYVHRKAGDTHIVRNTEMVRGAATQRITAETTRKKLKQTRHTAVTASSNRQPNSHVKGKVNKMRVTTAAERERDSLVRSTKMDTHRSKVKRDTQRSMAAVKQTQRQPVVRESRKSSQNAKSNVKRSRAASTAHRGTRQVTRSVSKRERSR